MPKGCDQFSYYGNKSNIPFNEVVGSLICKAVEAMAVIDFLPDSIFHFLFGIIMAAFNGLSIRLSRSPTSDLRLGLTSPISSGDH